ncbi:hypothetical protein [Hymenobacter sp. GOD-10R]|uniref:hypothetical protein n=1 Tax=Hymenobacter sp. GOD-10R TaxID=3093922 RepID=UPI002D76DDBD|nr:hypothetical protein [Hymenobacter sp. GOD-10R]WRQ30460.1 hypothetical protein SD425_09320 [Hymenobacter sp. GOD-10R]
MQPLEQQDVELVEKESIPTLHFPPDDVLSDPVEQNQRRHDAERATALGNAYHNKVSIYFQTDDGATKCVNTSVWATHEQYITLKSGITIPLRAVLGFTF